MLEDWETRTDTVQVAVEIREAACRARADGETTPVDETASFDAVPR